MSKMTGVKEMRRALRRLPDDLKTGVVEAIKETTKGVHERGKANIDAMTIRRSGLLFREYRRSVAPKQLRGRVGYLSATARAVVYYARFINDGTAKMEARPFHTNAVEAERELDTKRMVDARDKALLKATVR